MDLLKPCPCCGETPSFENHTECFGHGDYSKVWKLQCTCGLSTKRFIEGWQGTAEDCKEKAKAVWNRRT